MNAITIGLDLAKSVFQVHGEDAAGRIVFQKQLRRGQVETFFAKHPRCIVAMEACGSAHHWGRTVAALGHEVRLIPAAYVKPFVRRNKTDARDAAAICAAMGRPDMRYVALKSVAQQAMRSVERGRELLVKQQTQLTNCVRSLLTELGIVAPQGRRGFAQLRALVEAGDARVPEPLAATLQELMRQLDSLAKGVAELEARIMAAAKQDPAMRRLCTIPGIGGLTAHAIVAAIGDGRRFDTARDFAAWAGLTPRESSSGGKTTKLGISRQGERRLRSLFALGASTVMRNARASEGRATPWQRGILARRPVKVAVLAQAAKTARTAWAVLVSGQAYRQPANPQTQTLAA
jgi:transposase